MNNNQLQGVEQEIMYDVAEAAPDNLRAAGHARGNVGSGQLRRDVRQFIRNAEYVMEQQSFYRNPNTTNAMCLALVTNMPVVAINDIGTPRDLSWVIIPGTEL